VEKGQRLYITGSFNYWHEKDSLYQLKEIKKGVYGIILPVFAGRKYEYKYTLGSWNKVEVTAKDSDIHNRHFIAVNRKNIIDTVIKWKQPVTARVDSSIQLKEITAMKDSLIAKLKPEMNEILGLLKLYVQNMLQENPDRATHEKLDENATQKIDYLYREITNLLWNICDTLSAEQKQQIMKKLGQPVNGDFINSFLGAVNTTVK
jgi:hypothetical protein